ncbi:MAG: hypothetical protein R3E12_06975 [Candidatus Eisenbacteria bacterium]
MVKANTVVVFILLVRLLTDRDVAAIGIASGYLVVMAMLDVGPIRVLLRDYPTVARDRRSRDEHLTALVAFWIVQSAAMLLACLALEIWVLPRVGIDGLGFLFFALTVDFLAVSFQDWLKLIFYTAFQQTLATKFSFFLSIARVLCYGLLLFAPSLTTYAWILIATALVLCGIWWQLFRRRFDFHFLWHRRSIPILTASLRSYGLWDHLNRIVIDTVFTIDTVILSWFVAVEPISDYTVALRFTSLFFMIPMQLHLGLQVALSNYRERADQVAATNAFLKLSAAASLLQLAAVFWLGGPLIRLLFGGDTSPAVVQYATIIAIGVTVMNLSLPLLSVINNLGSLRHAFFTVFLPVLLLGLGIYVGATALRGTIGLAWANVAVYAIFALALVIYTFRHHPFPLAVTSLTPRERSFFRRVLRT